MSLSYNDAETAHAEMLDLICEATRTHVERRVKEMRADPDKTLDANDRQMLTTAAKHSKERLEFARDRETATFLLNHDDRYEEIGQGLCIGDVPGVLQRLYSLHINPPKDLKRYWFKQFDQAHPVIYDREGKPCRLRPEGGLVRIKEAGLPPAKGGAIYPLPDNGFELEPHEANFVPEEYGAGSMPIPGVTQYVVNRARISFWETYCEERGIPPMGEDYAAGNGREVERLESG